MCRNGYETCRLHKDYYKKRIWFNTFIIGDNRLADTVLLGYAPASSMFRLESHVREVLQAGKITVTKKDVASLPATERYIDIFILLCELPYVDPKWNKGLLQRAISFYFQLFQHTNEMVQTPYSLQELRLSPILQNPNMGFGPTLKCMLKVKNMRDNTAALARQPLATYHDLLFETMFIDYKQEYVWYSDSVLTKLFVPEKMSPNYFENNILPLLRQNKKIAFKAKKMNIDSLKEELVSVVFHPKNVARWLEEGGFEELERRF
jgi:hypothetical protein